MKNTPAIHPQWTDVPYANISLHAEALPVAAEDASNFEGLYLTGHFRSSTLCSPWGSFFSSCLGARLATT